MEKNVEGKGEIISQLMMNTTIDGITGRLVMNSNGDKLANYSILSMEPNLLTFGPAWSFSAQTRQLIPLKKVHWPGSCTNQAYKSMKTRLGGILESKENQ